MDEILQQAVSDFLKRCDNGEKITMGECEALINKVPGFTDEHGPETTREFLDFLGAPDRNIPIIHVAGTNGKGSVCSYISSALVKADYSVGMFTSPHLIKVNERFAIDGKPISEGVFVEVFTETLRRIDEFGREGFFPTSFELLFFVAMILYDVYPVDFLILETGLGGRLDATNSVEKPILTVITEIGYDHMQYLGTTIEDIAAEKAGIIKPGVPVVFFDKRPESTEVIKQRALKLDCRAIQVESRNIENVRLSRDEAGNKCIAFSYNSLYDKYTDLKLATEARYQAENGAVAVTCLEVLRDMGVRISELEIRQGLLAAKWEGRMEEIRPGIYVDGAHNVDGIDAFLDSVGQIECEGRKLLLFGVVGDKEYKDMILRILKSRQFESIYVTALATDRSVSVSDLKIAFEDSKDELGIIGLPIKYYSNVRDAVTDIITMRKSKDLIFAGGSLYLAGEIKSLV
ncbi:MAG: bifunctional folylpolyglutamate synthase/dihydrofolate synthase [Butyrivibrio sp.]|nr:bifunctional folylpolyglutamate synthase/dihydrofolate synthase [Butyrivibrio sp.]